MFEITLGHESDEKGYITVSEVIVYVNAKGNSSLFVIDNRTDEIYPSKVIKNTVTAYSTPITVNESDLGYKLRYSTIRLPLTSKQQLNDIVDNIKVTNERMSERYAQAKFKMTNNIPIVDLTKKNVSNVVNMVVVIKELDGVSRLGLWLGDIDHDVYEIEVTENNLLLRDNILAQVINGDLSTLNGHYGNRVVGMKINEYTIYNIVDMMELAAIVYKNNIPITYNGKKY